MNAGNGPEPDSLFSFPCSFPIKVMGLQEPGFAELVVALVESHVGEISADRIRTRESSKGRYLSVTVTVIAESRAQLDDVYRTLTAAEQVLLVL